MPKLRSSRRVPGLKDSDFDHEIDLVDRDDTPPATPNPVSPFTGGGEIGRSVTKSPLLSPDGPVSSAASSESGIKPPHRPTPNGGKGKGRAVSPDRGDASRSRPSIEIQGATPFAHPGALDRNQTTRPPTPSDAQSAIDVLYENERGGWLCGIPLFSSRALGNLDPTPWTNAYHRPSPTDTTNAQVPDPTWEWSWPEWRVYKHDGADEGGWLYSFMFSKKFSWHGPRWWNSFVRRRAWIRRRVKKRQDLLGGGGSGVGVGDPHMLNTEYFSVRPSSERSRGRRSTIGGRSSVVGSRASRASMASAMSEADQEALDAAKQPIEDADTLLFVLRRARIDREKLEAVENYLEHGGPDLVELEGKMHDIMVNFVFQASRKLLLSHLTQKLDETVSALRKRGGVECQGEAEGEGKVEGKVEGQDEDRGEGQGQGKGQEQGEGKIEGEKEGDTSLSSLEERRHHLEAAVKKADAEVRKLAYWSDIKGMVESGETAHAVRQGKGWGGEWEGVDQSGPAGPRKED